MYGRKNRKGFAELLSERARSHPAQPALIFLETKGNQQQALELTYASLHERAGALAAELTRRGLKGQRVLLLFPSGLEYASAFLACIYAGVTAVPVYPPRNNWHAERVAIIARDAGATATLTMPELIEKTEVRLHAMGLTDPGIIRFANLDCKGDDWVPRPLELDSLAIEIGKSDD